MFGAFLLFLPGKAKNMTEKLYYKDSYIHSFKAQVIACTEAKGGYGVILDKTAFFPEGGGQPSDAGTIGNAHVLDVQISKGDIIHYVSAPLNTGTVYDCKIDWDLRFRRMQNHSGEHLVSGIAHSKFGCDNVGFHMGNDCMTVDFNIELTRDALRFIEREANRAVYENVEISTVFPSQSELRTIDYRSKLDLADDVRLIVINGYDICACCAPHVARTGEIGVIKILSSMRHRGGVRLTMIAGRDAYDDYVVKHGYNAEISALLSSKPNETTDAVQHLLNTLQKTKFENGSLKRELAALYFSSASADQNGNVCVFCPSIDTDVVREHVNVLTSKYTGFCAAFSGSDDEGYRYIIASRDLDSRQFVSSLNAALGGRGGGSAKMVQGSVKALKSDIEVFFKSL